MTDETRLKRLHMRSIRRGIKEMDLILGAFAASRLPGLDAAALDTYEALLQENDHDLYAWVTARIGAGGGQGRGPAAYGALLDAIATHAAGALAR